MEQDQGALRDIGFNISEFKAPDKESFVNGLTYVRREVKIEIMSQKKKKKKKETSKVPQNTFNEDIDAILSGGKNKETNRTTSISAPQKNVSTIL